MSQSPDSQAVDTSASYRWVAVEDMSEDQRAAAGVVRTEQRDNVDRVTISYFDREGEEVDGWTELSVPCSVASPTTFHEVEPAGIP